MSLNIKHQMNFALIRSSYDIKKSRSNASSGPVAQKRRVETRQLIREHVLLFQTAFNLLEEFSRKSVVKHDIPRFFGPGYTLLDFVAWP